MAFRPESVDSTVSQIAALQNARSSLLIFNSGTATVFLSNDRDRVTTRGLPIAAAEHISMTREEGDEPELALFAQTVAGTADLRIKEGFEEGVKP